jgi:hypothetical protein
MRTAESSSRASAARASARRSPAATTARTSSAASPPAAAGRRSRASGPQHRPRGGGQVRRQHLADLRPGPFAADAILEAADAGIPTAICITEGIPTLDMMRVKRALRRQKTRLIGPNCPGVINPAARSRAGIMPVDVYRPGRGRHLALRHAGLRGGRPAHPPRHRPVGLRRRRRRPDHRHLQREALELFEADPDTKAIVLIGEIGGTAEQEAAEYIKQMSKPVVAFIAGRHRAAGPPHGPRRRDHRRRRRHRRGAKQQALRDAGATVVENPGDIGDPEPHDAARPARRRGAGRAIGRTRRRRPRPHRTRASRLSAVPGRAYPDPRARRVLRGPRGSRRHRARRPRRGRSR